MPSTTVHPLVPQGAGTYWTSVLYTAGIAAVTFLLILVWTKKRNSHPKRAALPPGPKGLPFLGFVPFLHKNLDHIQFREWSKVYGPILRVKIAGLNVIILNDFETVKEFLNRREILHRGANLFTDIMGLKGVSSLNGQEWVDNRRFCLRVLRDLGFGRKSIEGHIKEECLYLAQKYGESKGRPVEVDKYLISSLSNNITALVFGRRYTMEDPRRQYLDDLLNRALKLFGSGFIATFMPQFLVNLAARIPFTREGALMKILLGLADFVTKEVREHEATLDPYYNRDFIDGYLKKITEHKDESKSSFRHTYLTGHIGDFFGAGSNTVRVTVEWHLLNCADKRDTIQSKIQEEIDEQVGRERQPQWEDSKKMPFTMACIWEMFRCKDVIPLSVPRTASDDTYFHKYFIPKGTMVMPNLWAVHMDPRLWNRPEVFDPSRFLDENGQLMKKPEYLIPFSVGKRMCPAETLATVEVFLYLTTLLQKYNVLPEEGQAVRLDSMTVMMNIPFPQKLRFVPR